MPDAVEPAPECLHTVTPRLVFSNEAAAAMRLYVQAFGVDMLEQPFVDPDGRADQFYGDRGGRLRDPFGHQWMLSTHIEDLDREELDRRMQAWSEQES